MNRYILTVFLFLHFSGNVFAQVTTIATEILVTSLPE